MHKELESGGTHIMSPSPKCLGRASRSSQSCVRALRLFQINNLSQTHARRANDNLANQLYGADLRYFFAFYVTRVETFYISGSNQDTAAVSICVGYSCLSKYR